MRNLTLMTKVIIIIVALVAIGLLFVVFYFIPTKFPLPPEDALRVQYLAQYVEIVKVFAIGIGVTLFSVILPKTLPEARDKFERYKESRQAYSRAKTAVIYLPDRVLNLDEDKAFVLIEEAHREIHLAEMFEDVIIKKGYVKWFANPELWILYNYWQIVAVATVLRIHNSGNPMNREILKSSLKCALAVVHDRFGKTGKNCKGEVWSISDGSRFENEEELQKRIEFSALSCSKNTDVRALNIL